MTTYSYADYLKIANVGDIVSAVPGKNNPCKQLNNDGSNTEKITEVTDDHFSINGCSHPYLNDGYLNLHRTLSWENLREGSVVVDEDGDEALVLEVGKNSFMRSIFGDFKTVSEWLTVDEAKRNGWTLKGAPESEPADITAAKALLESKGYSVTKNSK